MTRMRLVREPARTCDGCSLRLQVLRIELGDHVARLCHLCFDQLILGRSAVATFGLDAWEPRL